MTRAGRVLLGSLLGAAFTLAIHPLSRPYLASVIVAPSIDTAAAKTRSTTDDLPTLATWAISATSGAGPGKLTPANLDRAIATVRRGAALDPGNAFWPQLLAGLYHARHDEANAFHEWVRAASLTSWNDYQTQALTRDALTLEREFGGAQAWQYAYLYFQRSDGAARVIAGYGRYLLQNAPIDTPEGLRIRVANIRNGDSLRAGARSIRVGDYGAQLAEMSCHPPGLSTSNHHRLFLLRMSFYDDLRKTGHEAAAEQVNRIYREVDAWSALTNDDDAFARVQDLTFESLLVANLPSAFAVIGLTGLVVWLLGRAFYRVEEIPLPFAAGLGLLLGFGAFLVTRLFLAGAATLLCCLFLAMRTKHERRARTEDLGPMFSFTIGTLGVVFIGLLGAFLVGQSASAVSLLPYFAVPPDYFGGSGVLLGLSFIVLGLVLLVAPWFAIALRYGTPFVVGAAVRKFGAFLGYFGLIVVVFGTPICIYEDRALSQTLGHLVSNEPVVYYEVLQR